MCFSAYHAVRRSNVTGNLMPDTRALGPRQFLPIHGLFADTLFVEALDLGISTAKFQPTLNSVQENLEFVQHIFTWQFFEEGSQILIGPSGAHRPTGIGLGGARGTATSTSEPELPPSNDTLCDNL